MKVGFALFAAVVGVNQWTVSESTIVPPGANNFYDPPYDANRKYVVEPYDQCSKFVAPDAKGNDRFGFSTAYEGSVIAVSAPYHMDCKGAVYIFEDGNNGEFVHKIMSPNSREFELFGEKISLNNDVLVIGSSRENGNRGAAYVYVRVAPVNSGEQSSWVYAGELRVASAQERDRFGWSVATSGTGDVSYVAIGGVGEDAGKVLNVGSVHVWKVTKSTKAIEYVQKIAGQTQTKQDLFGSSLSMHKNYLAVGAYGTDEETGVVYIYAPKADGTYEFKYSVQAEAPTKGDRFGFSVSLSDGVLAVGSDGYNLRTGAVDTYSISESAANFVERLVPEDCQPGDGCGSSVSLFESGSLLMGAYFNDVDKYWGGSAFLFNFNSKTSKWALKRRFKPYEGHERDYFSYSIALNKKYALIGATGDDSAANHGGAVWMCPTGDQEKVEEPDCDTKQYVSKVDVLYIVDDSGSISNKEWKAVTRFLKGVSNAMDMGNDANRFALVSFSTKINAVIEFGEFESINAVGWRSFINTQLTKEGGVTALPLALIEGKSVFSFTPRADAKRVVVVITDGAPNRNYGCYESGFSSGFNKCSQQAAAALKAMGAGSEDDVKFVYVPLGKYANQNLFKDQTDYTIPTTFSELVGIIAELKTELSCF